MIIILTEATDPHADLVGEKLRDRGADFIRFNPAEFPSQAEISHSYTFTGQVQCVLRTGSQSIDLNAVKAVWYRRPKPPVPHEEISDQSSRDFITEECNFFLQDLWNLLECRWLPAPPSAIRRADLKASQLKIAAALGFEVPPTLFSNSPADFLDFYNQHSGQIVTKLAGPPFLGSLGKTFMRYTEVVSKRDAGYAQAIRYCPVIFQAYIPKRLELRITVVGQQVFAAEIHSQKTNHTRHDWRRYDHQKTLYLPHNLPPNLKNLCVRLVEILRLSYGAIDMILTPDGRYVFLEINPNGQYLWVEQSTGLPISDAICDWLISASPATKPTEYSAYKSFV